MHKPSIVWPYAALLAALSLPSLALSQTSTLHASDVEGSPGQTVQVAITLDNQSGDVQGWSLGLAVPSELTVASATDGAATAALNQGAGADFNQTTIHPLEGVTSGVVISFPGFEVLPAGADYELHVLEVTIPAGAVPGQVYALDFTDAIGSPPVATLIVVGGQSLVPDLSGGTITVTWDSYCECDGSVAPCGNAGPPGSGCLNSTGEAGRLAAQGSSSVSSGALDFTATGLVPGAPMMLFCGTQRVNAGSGFLFGDGLRCAGGQVTRLGVRFPDADGAVELNLSPGQAGWQAGEIRHFQGWYRDPGQTPCGSSFNLTQAVSITMAP